MLRLASPHFNDMYMHYLEAQAAVQDAYGSRWRCS